jgi:hypothetical protein
MPPRAARLAKLPRQRNGPRTVTQATTGANTSAMRAGF